MEEPAGRPALNYGGLCCAVVGLSADTAVRSAFGQQRKELLGGNAVLAPVLTGACVGATAPSRLGRSCWSAGWHAIRAARLSESHAGSWCEAPGERGVNRRCARQLPTRKDFDHDHASTRARARCTNFSSSSGASSEGSGTASWRRAWTRLSFRLAPASRP